MTIMTAQEMRRLLYRHYAARCAVLFEIASDPRQEEPGTPRQRARIIDALTVQRARKPGIGPLDLMAIEIKVSRPDFLTDIRNPAKQAGWREIAHRHAYAVPDGLVKPEEIPAGSGLLVAKTRPGGYQLLEWGRRAPYTETPELRSWLTLSLAWRMAEAEAKVRGLTGMTGDSATAEDLRGELQHVRGLLDKANAEAHRARDVAGKWRDAYAMQADLPCAHCGNPVRYRGPRGMSGWRHTVPADEMACLQVRHRYSQVYPADAVEPPEAS